jgi:hypothetical protein
MMNNAGLGVHYRYPQLETPPPILDDEYLEKIFLPNKYVTKLSEQNRYKSFDHCPDTDAFIFRMFPDYTATEMAIKLGVKNTKTTPFFSEMKEIEKSTRLDPVLYSQDNLLCKITTPSIPMTTYQRNCVMLAVPAVPAVPFKRDVHKLVNHIADDILWEETYLSLLSAWNSVKSNTHALDYKSISDEVRTIPYLPDVV